MAIETHVHDGASWRKAKQIYVHDGSAWRDVKEAWCHDGTAWRKVFTRGYWQLVTTSMTGLPTGSQRDVYVYNGEVYVSLVTGSPGSWGLQVYRWNGASWDALGSPIATINASFGLLHEIPFRSAYGVHIVTIDEGKVYYYNGSSWILAFDGYGAISGVNDLIDNAIADSSAAYYPLGFATNNLERWNGSSSSFLAGAGYPTSSVFFGGTIYSITSTDAGATYKVRYWTGSAWALHSTIGNDDTFVLRTDGTTLYAVSLYDGVKRWNGSSWVSVSGVDTYEVYGRRFATVNGKLLLEAVAGYPPNGKYPAIFSAGSKVADLITEISGVPIYFKHYIMSNGELYGAQRDGSTSDSNVYKWVGDLPA